MPGIGGVAHARIGLLGNPSDGYGGKALACALSDFSARVDLTQSRRLEVQPSSAEGFGFDSLVAADRHFLREGCQGGHRLIRAALRRFCLAHPGILSLPTDDPSLCFELRYETDVPRQVGLAGSSAIVIAALRALAAWFERPLPPPRLAELALAAEFEELGIAGGPMDRLVQAHEGLLAMDLAVGDGDFPCRSLDPGLLPDFFIAWDPRGGEPSGIAHGDLRNRWRAGDPDVLAAIQSYRRWVDAGILCLENSDHAGFRTLVDRNFDLRTQIFSVTAVDRELVGLARAEGAAAKLCGSGGAIVGLPAEQTDRDRLAERFREAGFRFLEPAVALSPLSSPPGIRRVGESSP